MARLAAAGATRVVRVRFELDRDGPSFTYDTLIARRSRWRRSRQATWRTRYADFLHHGADAFAEIATWSRYPAVLDLAHFVVVSRPGITLDSLRERVPSAFSRPRRASQNTRDSGRSRTLPTFRRPTFGAACAPATASPVSCLISVADYIRDHRLYLENRLAWQKPPARGRPRITDSKDSAEATAKAARRACQRRSARD